MPESKRTPVKSTLQDRGLRPPSPPRELPHPGDERFSDPVWRDSPFWSHVMESYLLFTHATEDAIYSMPCSDDCDRRKLAFWTRQWLNAIAPTNFLWTNPVALRKAFESGGDSLLRGWRIFLEDAAAGTVRMTGPRDFQVGGNLALTPGAVVARNKLLELIHYAPVARTVHRTPLVIVTPWINKYYILDLVPAKSLVAYLLAQGFDVYITSWKNPGASMRDTSFDDYLLEGIDHAVRVARSVSGSDLAHVVGYCIGGTLASVYMAWLNRRFGDPAKVPVSHWSLFATLTDFRAPGDIEAFIDEPTLAMLDAMMASRGFLDGAEMALSFRMLRPNPLIWQYVVHGWLYGEEPRPLDVLYWNMDTTRMPYRMHSYYLREMYLGNNLVKKDALTVAGERIDLGRIAQPLYLVGAEDDHIAPWRESFRITGHLKAPTRFALSSSGHILGIVNPPVTPPRRSFRAAAVAKGESAERWLGRHPAKDGTWWEDWVAWLRPRCGPRRAPPPLATARYPKLADAPGTYVLER